MPPIEAVRTGIHDVMDRITPEEWAREQARQRMFQRVPELRARVLQQYVQAIDLLAALAAVPHGMTTADGRADLERVDRALSLLQDGLPL
jgi:hypothetical protein